jgi:restriction endonuclease Mrr
LVLGYREFMSIPDDQTCMLPFLRMLEDGHEHSLREGEEVLAARFALTPGERAELLPSGRQAIFKNRIGWARSYLKKAGVMHHNASRWVVRWHSPAVPSQHRKTVRGSKT